MGDLKQVLQSGAEKLQVNLDTVQLDQFMAYLDLLVRWNKTFNLTAITDPKQIVIKHFLDSISVSPFVAGKRILDVGAGAGLPGIPLALLYPEIQIDLLDCNGKKTRFMQQVVAQLCLDHVKVFNCRVEQCQPLETYDQIYSRAFSSLEDKCNSVDHLLQPQGRIMAMKGVIPKDELNNLPIQFELLSVHSLAVPDLDAEERHLIEIQRKKDIK